MIQENEIIKLLLFVIVFVFIFQNRAKVKGICEWRLLLAGFYVHFAAGALTVLEGFFMGWFLNMLEHLCYAASACLLGLWCWRTLVRGKELSA